MHVPHCVWLPNASAKLPRMHDPVAVGPPDQSGLSLVLTTIRAGLPSLYQAAFAVGSALLLILAFPNFDFWWLAWFGLVPLIFIIGQTRRALTAFWLGMLWGTIFFYGTCWWLTYPMIRYGGVPGWRAYPLLLLPVVFVSIFPGLACVCVSRVVARFGTYSILTAPVFWVSFDWLRYMITGMVWNTVGYSQAFHPSMIQSARFGGVYAITFLIVLTSSAVALLLLRPGRHSLIVSGLVLISVIFLIILTKPTPHFDRTRIDFTKATLVVAVQPNVPMESQDDPAMKLLLQRHLQLSIQGLASKQSEPYANRLVIWPESPMNFQYSRDPELQDAVASFARANRVSILLNSLEPDPDGEGFNSALLINEEGRIVARYDKIRLMPFGEYVPLPRWLPGSGSVRSIVGEFTPGSSYTLMPLGAVRAGVFICVEAVHPAIARSFTHAGADVLINISNDGYLGPTPVMRQHLANAVFRAVENDRDLMRVTNTGITAYIRADGALEDVTPGFQEAVRTWSINQRSGTSFYSRHGDVFVYGCALFSLGVISASFMTRSQYRERSDRV
jgi:apolipoprotein N-acyltransferase